MAKTKIEIVEFEGIKKLINSNSIKYNNFKDFSVVNDFKNQGKYIVYLNFYDEEIEDREECIRVEVIRNILHREIDTVIENAEKDFDNFIGQEIIENIEKTNFVDIILKYNVNRRVKKFNLACLKRWSGGYDSKTKVSNIHFKVTCYNPEDTYDLVGKEKTHKQLCIESNENAMIISLYDPRKSILLGIDSDNVKEMLYFIKYEKDRLQYIISRYDEKNNRNWSRKKVIVEEIATKSVNIEELSDIIVRFIEDKFELIIDINSKVNFERELGSRINNIGDNN